MTQDTKKDEGTIIKKKIEYYQKRKINRPIDGTLVRWNDVKNEMLSLYNYIAQKNGLNSKFFFILPNNDKIKGKPILRERTKFHLDLLRVWLNKKSKEIAFQFIDDKAKDSRYYERLSDKDISKSLYQYEIINEYDDEKYIFFSNKLLKSKVYEIKGLKIEIDSEIDNSKKSSIKVKDRIFISLDKPKSTEMILPTDELVELTKKLKYLYGLDKEGFIEYLYTHNKDHLVYRQSPILEEVRIAQLFSGRYEGYPLHTLFIGPSGIGKTIELEAITYKFNENILEASTSTLKSLTPSFKKDSITPGFLLKSSRIAAVDELSKMVEKQLRSIQDTSVSGNILSSLNSLLEGKERIVGSGNTGGAELTCTAQVMFSSNFLVKRQFLSQHLEIFDETMLARVFPIVIGPDDYDFIQQNKGNVKRSRFNIKANVEKYWKTDSEKKLEEDTIKRMNFKYNININKVKINNKEINFIYTLYDSCKEINIFDKYDTNKIDNIKNSCIVLLKNNKLKSLLSSRWHHHLILLLDGHVKFRCLFEDYDPTFSVKDEDYDWLERVAVYITQNYEKMYNFSEI